MRFRNCRRLGVIVGVLLLGVVGASAQGFITTVAGGNWVFNSTNVPALNAPLGNPRGLAVDASGNLYAADSANTVIVKITPAGVLTIVAGNGTGGSSGDGGPAVNAQINNPQALLFDPSGNLLIADQNANRVRRVSTNGTITTIAGTGSGTDSGDGGQATAAGISGPVGVALDGSGNLYISEQNGHRVRMVTPGGIISTIAGTGSSGYSGDGGPATGANLNSPAGLTVDATGNLYIADRNNNRIRKVAGGNISTIAGGGNAGDGSPATTASLGGPNGLWFDAAGNLFIAESNSSRIRKVDTSGAIVAVAGTGSNDFGGDGGPAPSALLFNPAFVALDASNNLYIADSSNQRIRKVSAGIISTIAGNGLFKFTGDGGPATSANLWSPQGVAVDAQRNIYIADSPNRRVRKVSPTGIITTLAGNGNYRYTGDGGPATAASMRYPTRVVLDAAGNIYVTDADSNVIRKIDSAGTISTFAGTGTGDFAGDGGPAVAASFRSPWDMAIDAAGNFYVLDSNNYRIRKITSGGTISTIAGNGVQGASGDGNLAIAASLDRPRGIAVDAQGNIYFTDRHRVRKIFADSGIITTIAGTVTSGYSGDGGAATAAALNNALGIVVDPSGFLFVADQTNRRIRRISTDGIITTAIGNGNCCNSGDGGPATLATLNNPAGLALDAAGRVFIADSNDRIRVAAPADGFVHARAATAAPGTAAHVPIFVALNSGAAFDSISFSVMVSANGAAPAVAGPLGFLPDPDAPAPELADTSAAPNIISLAYSSASIPAPARTPGVMAGAVLVPIPPSAAIGQSYTAQVTGSGAALGSAPVLIGTGTTGMITVARSFLVGDVTPQPSTAGDLNSDGLFDGAGEFGDGNLDNLDLITALRAVTNVPGFRPRPCSDLYDAFDSFPADTVTDRGGDGVLTNLDLITTLRRVTNVDTSRPVRASRLSCVLGRGSFETLARARDELRAGAIELGAARPRRGFVRVPIYLVTGKDLALAGLSYSVAADGAAVHFVAAGIPAALVDEGVPGIVAVAHFASVRVPAGERVLLGYIEAVAAGNAAPAFRILGVEATALDGHSVRLDFDHPTRTNTEGPQ